MKDKLIQIRVDEQMKKELQTSADIAKRKLADFVRVAALHVAKNKIKI